MKKLIIAILVIVVIILIFVFSGGKKEAGPEEMASLIQDAFQGKIAVQCEYSLEDMNAQTTTYIKGENLRVDTVDENDQHFNIIYTDQVVYFWQEETGFGFMFDSPDDEDVEDMGNGVQSREEIEAEIDKYQDYCEKASLSSNIFDPPANINFQSVDQLLQMPGI